jgi:hypothetical protein
LQGDDSIGENVSNIDIQNNDENRDFERPAKRVKFDSADSNNNHNNHNYNDKDNDSNDKNSENNDSKTTNKKIRDISTDIVVRNVFDSELLRVSFTKDMWGRLLVPTGAIESDSFSNDSNNDSSGISLEDRQAYGVQYNFCLNDEVGANKAAVDAPEWLVPQVHRYVYKYIYEWMSIYIYRYAHVYSKIGWYMYLELFIRIYLYVFLYTMYHYFIGRALKSPCL